MTINEYFKYAVLNGLLNKLDWYFTVMTIPISDILDNEYISVKDGNYYVKIDNGTAQITGIDTKEPLFKVDTKLILSNEVFVNIPGKIDTKFGIAIANYLLLTDPFGNKIDYINGEVDASKIESKILDLLTSDKVSDKEITIKEYTKFADNANFMVNFSRLVSVSATYKSMLPPPGIVEYKNKVMKEFRDKYGDDVFTDYTKVAELETLLKDFDDAWLKDDPSYGKLTSGKVKNKARVKLFLTYGAETGFDRSGKAMLVKNSLNEGWPTDTEELSRMYNASRAGSYDRGSETQKGGTAAKVVLRATNSIRIVDNDCGSRLTKPFFVTNSNSAVTIGRNILDNGKLIPITSTNINSYIGKEVKFRSPAYCLEKDGNFCSACVGPKLTTYKDGISLLVLNVSSILLAISMSKIHGQELSTIELDLDDAIN